MVANSLNVVPIVLQYGERMIFPAIKYKVVWIEHYLRIPVKIRTRKAIRGEYLEIRNQKSETQKFCVQKHCNPKEKLD